MARTAAGALYPVNLSGSRGGESVATTLSSYLRNPINDDNPVPVVGVPTALDPTTTPAPKHSILWDLAAVVLLLVLLKFAIEHEKSGVDPAFVGIGVWNWVAVGLMAMTFLIIAKTLANKYSIPGLTHLINAS